MKKFEYIKQFIVREQKILIFFIFVLLLMMPYLIMNIGFIDEMDNLLGGRITADGGVLYRDYITQHTPLAYYLMALFAKMGITSVIGARILFYVIIVVFFMFVYFRYKMYFGAKTLLILPVLFVLDIARHGYMTCILYDMFQAMALLVLFLEFYIFCTKKPNKLSMSSTTLISLSIFFAMGSAFLSVYAIAVIFLGVFISEIERAFSNKQMKLTVRHKEIFLRYIPLVITLSVLFIIYCGYFTINHALKDMIYQSYTFNREIYPRYIGGAYISKFKTVFDGLNNYANHISGSFTKLYTLETLVPALLIIGNTGACFLFIKKSKVLGLTTVLFVIYTGIRGYTGFHSTAYIMFSWFCLAFIMEHIILANKKQHTLFAAIVVAVLCFAPLYGKEIKNIYSLLIRNYDQPSKNYYIEKYIPKGGYFFNSSLDLSAYLNNNLKMASRMYAILPWYCDAFMPSIINDLERNKPNVIFYHPDDDVWGRKNKDYCQTLEELLQRDYIYYPDSDAAFEHTDGFSDRVWIRKGIGVMSMGARDNFYKSKPNGRHIGELTKNIVIKQTFLSNDNNLCSIQIMFATFARANSSTINLQLYDETGALINEQTIQSSAMLDNSYLLYKFPDINDSLGQYYFLVISSNEAVSGNAVTILCTNEDSYEGELFINDKRDKDILCIIPIYNKDLIN
jgi:hypothetical protein